MNTKDIELMFDIESANVQSERNRKQRELLQMDADERVWIDETIEKLKFLRERGFEVKPYFGGIVDGYPYNYIKIARNGYWLQIEGCSARRDNGAFDQVSPYIQSKRTLTIESLIRTIARW